MATDWNSGANTGDAELNAYYNLLGVDYVGGDNLPGPSYAAADAARVVENIDWHRHMTDQSADAILGGTAFQGFGNLVKHFNMDRDAVSQWMYDWENYQISVAGRSWQTWGLPHDQWADTAAVDTILQQRGLSGDPNYINYRNNVQASNDAWAQNLVDAEKAQEKADTMRLVSMIGMVVAPVLGPLIGGAFGAVGAGAETAALAALGEGGMLGAGGAELAGLGLGGAELGGTFGALSATWDALGPIGQSLLKNVGTQLLTSGDIDLKSLGMSALGPALNMGFDSMGGWGGFTGGMFGGGDGYMDLGSWADQGPQGSFNFADESRRLMNPTADLPMNDPYAVSGFQPTEDFSNLFSSSSYMNQPGFTSLEGIDDPNLAGFTSPVDRDVLPELSASVETPPSGETPPTETPTETTPSEKGAETKTGPKEGKSPFSSIKPSQLMSLAKRLLGSLGKDDRREARRLMDETDESDPADVARRVKEANQIIEELLGTDVDKLTAEEFSKRLELLESKRSKDFARLVGALYARGQLGIATYGEAATDEITGEDQSYDLADGEAANPFMAAYQAGLAREDVQIANSSRDDAEGYINSLMKRLNEVSNGDRWDQTISDTRGMFSGAQLDDAAAQESMRRKRLDELGVA